MNNWTLIWAGVSALATVASFIVITVAAFLTFRQVRESSRSRQLEGALAILEHISSADLRNARRLIFTMHEKLAERISSSPTWEEIDAFLRGASGNRVDADKFHSYLASLENVSILVLNDLAPDTIIDMYFGHMAVSHWEHLKPFINYMRRLYGSDDFLQHFEMFVILIREDGLDVIREIEPTFAIDSSSELKRRLLLERRRERLDSANSKK